MLVKGATDVDRDYLAANQGCHKPHQRPVDWVPAAEERICQIVSALTYIWGLIRNIDEVLPQVLLALSAYRKYKERNRRFIKADYVKMKLSKSKAHCIVYF